ncbi:MAG: Cna B-type domain-containing protein [Ruminococcaceae bacterium]|nr:Cna B-type domain-containing protein [Oscillospiraceae bacterium]
MNKKRFINLISCLIVFILIFSVTVCAESIDFERKGSIKIRLYDNVNETFVTGAEFVAVKIGSIDKGGNFILSEDFSEIDVHENNIGEISEFIRENEIEGITCETTEEGTAVFSELELGEYIVIETKPADDYYASEPFLVQIPATNESGTGYIYDIEASPKVDAFPEEPVTLNIKKVWSDSGEERPQYVEIEIYDGEDLVDTVILSEDNNWQLKIEKLMPPKDKYTVKEINIPEGYRVSYSLSGDTLIVTNSSTLIQTGQVNWPIPVLIVSGLVIIVFGIILIKRKR